MGAVMCKLNCECGRHRSRTVDERTRIGAAQRGVPKPQPSCVEGCTCAKHIISEEHRRRIGDANRGRSRVITWWTGHSCEEGCQCGRHTRSGNLHPVASWRPGQEPWNKGRTGVYTAEMLEAMSQAMGRRLKSGVYRRSPNGVEQLVLGLLPTPGQYVGSGQLVIGNKCPDFWNGNGKVIEVYGDYWHRGQDPQERIDLFKVHGYDCFVIWEAEVHVGEVAGLLEFAGGGG